MIYTIYDPISYDVLYAQEFEQAPENSTLSVMFNSYIKPKYNPDTDTFYEGASLQEQMIAKIEDEFQRYLKRKADGEAYHLRICAELRVMKLEGGISQEQYDAIYTILGPTRNEVVTGNWISGLKELEKAQSYLSPTLYNRLYLDISTYITENY